MGRICWLSGHLLSYTYTSNMLYSIGHVRMMQMDSLGCGGHILQHVMYTHGKHIITKHGTQHRHASDVIGCFAAQAFTAVVSMRMNIYL